MYGKKEGKNRFTGWVAVALLCLSFMALFGCGRDTSVVLESLSDVSGTEGGGSENLKKEPDTDDGKADADNRPEKVGETVRDTETTAEPLRVHVCGAVRIPGVYKLPSGSRIFEAVEAAGGMTEEAAKDYLNLADMVFDGAKVRVPFLSELSGDEVYGEPGAFGVTGMQVAEDFLPEHVARNDPKDGVNGGADNLVDLNHADRETLMTLPGIGEAKAEALISWREEHGPFGKPEDIMQVPGIKEAAYEKLKDKITVKN